MTNTVHTIRVGVKPTTNMQAELDKMTRRFKINIAKGRGRFIQETTQITKQMAQEEAKIFQFRGDLWRGIAMKFFKKTGRGEVFIISSQIQKAIMNEFGQTPPVTLPNVGKLQDWANQKAPHLVNRKNIKIGFTGTGSHVIAPNPRNRFWGVTAVRINSKMDMFFKRYLEKIIRAS